MADIVTLGDVSTKDTGSGSKLKTGGRRKYNMAKQNLRVKAKPTPLQKIDKKATQKKEKSKAKKCKLGTVYDVKTKKCKSNRKKGETLMEWQFRNMQESMKNKKRVT